MMDNLNIKRLEQLRATFDDVRLSRLLQEYEEKCAANIVAMLGALNAVSYTHLTLPTIYSV